MAPRPTGSGALRLGLLAVTLVGLGALALVLLNGNAIGEGAPAFSSLRTDPAGTSVLFGAYARAGLNVVHGLEPERLAQLSPPDTVAFELAPTELGAATADQLYQFARRGGLLVLAGFPEPRPVAGAHEAGGGEPTPPSLPQRLGAELVRGKESADAPGFAGFQVMDPAVSLRLSAAWTPVLQRGARVYLAQRRLGTGRVVMASEATFLSNDALARDVAGAPGVALDLLSGFSRGRSTVWVDETTHGMEQVRGIPWLIRRYHLQAAVVAGLAALALLAWSASGSLQREPDLEGAEEDEPDGATMAESARAGYIRLLRRAIPPAQLAEYYERQMHGERKSPSDTRPR